MSERPMQRRRWGHWRFNGQNLTLEYLSALPGMRPQVEYAVELERCKCSAEVLDSMCEVMHKSWTSNEDVGDLLEAIDTLSGGLQSVMCGGGVETMEGRNWAGELR